MTMIKIGDEKEPKKQFGALATLASNPLIFEFTVGDDKIKFKGEIGCNIEGKELTLKISGNN